jgi:LacI family transcriptional regulator
MIKQKSVILLLERYDHRIHLGVSRYAGEHKWHLNAHMANTTGIPRGWKGDGIITSMDRRPDLVSFIRNARIPKVDVAIARPDIRIPRVIGDNPAIGQFAAEHFLERGLRNFAWFSNRPGNVGQLRFIAFMDHLAKHGFACTNLTEGQRASKTEKAGQNMHRWLGQTLVKLPQPLGIFAYNDYDAADVIDTCLSYGLSVPDDVAVLGVDNNEMVCTCQTVPISSINHDLERIGYQAAALLDRLMNGKPAPKHDTLIPPRGITVRQSTDTMAVHHPAVRKALLFLRENFSKSFSTIEMADAAGTSRRTLEIAFRKELKRSIHEETLRFRLNRARDYLLNTGSRIIDIAAHTGFCHPQHLNNSFKKSFGCTPLKYRKKYRTPSE